MKKIKKKKSKTIKIVMMAFFFGVIFLVGFFGTVLFISQKEETEKAEKNEEKAKPKPSLSMGTPSENGQGFGDWQYSKNAGGGYAFTESNSGTNTAGIGVKCFFGTVFVMYIPGKDVGKGEDRKVKYWIDDIGPVTERWTLEGDKIENFDGKQSKALALKMMDGDRLKIGANDLSYSAHTHSFSLRGAYAALTRVLEKCGG